MEADYSAFGQLVRELREAHDLTQADLAHRLGYAADTISKLEAGRRRPSKQLVDLLAATLDLPSAVRPTFFRLARSGSPALAPPLPSALLTAARSPTLPTFLTPFLGRSTEVMTLHRLLVQDHRPLVTLTGLGGIGKTRLAVQVATRLAEAFADGCVFVDLAAIQDPTLVWPALAHALGQPEAAANAEARGLLSYLHDKHLLLILDNCEQIPHLGPHLERLLAQAPTLSLLLTSRTTLRLPGEQVVPLLPFPLPPP